VRLPGIGALRVWRRDVEVWRRFLLTFVVASLGEPLFYLLAMGYGLGRYVADIGGVPYVAFLAPGIVAAATMNAASVEATFGSYTRMAEQQTYAAILATPCSVADVVAGDVLYAATKGAAAATFVLLVTAPLGVLHGPLALAVVPTTLLAGLTFGALGVAVTARAPSYDYFNYYFTFGISVMFLFGGVFFPLDTLPAWARIVAWLLPLTHAVAACRMLASGTLTPALPGHLLWLATVAALAYAAAERQVRRRLLV
jgi:lipooligosaccharide transport system permease protein